MKYLLLIAVSALATVASAKIEILSAISVETDIPVWNKEYAQKVSIMKSSNTYPEEGYTECRPVNEVEQAYLCLSNTQRGMNTSLGRASFFIEGLANPANKGKVISQSNPTYEMYKSMIGGHDLKGEDLLKFHSQVKKDCEASQNNQDICHNPYENDIFENFIVPYAKKLTNFVVITFANQSGMGWQETVTHEIMHAQYFNQPKYKEIVDAFWQKEVLESDKKDIRRSLSQYYDSSDELLMLNEFQAYILMSGAERSMLATHVAKYRAPLMKLLAESGVKPVQVK